MSSTDVQCLYRRVAQLHAARALVADLTPPLGDPGGPCQVIERVRARLPDGPLEDAVVEALQGGQELKGPVDAKVYPPIREPGTPPFKYLEFIPHAEYRMDGRSITVDDVRGALKQFSKYLQTLQQKNPDAHARLKLKLALGDKVEYLEGRTNLFLVFQLNRDGGVKVVTAYVKGAPDPGRSCRLATTLLVPSKV